MSEEANSLTTVVVVTYNSAAVIKSCLERIDAKTPVIVVDNASSDDTCELVFSVRPATKIVSSGGNLGYGSAANLGFQHVLTPYAFLLNPDTLLERESIQTLEKAVSRHPGRAIFAPTVVSMDGQPQNQYTEVVPGSGTEVDLSFASGCALFFDLRALECIGRFDESFFLYYEETDLCRRAVDMGLPTVFVPSASVTHLDGKSSSDRPAGPITAHMIWSRCYFAAKHQNSLLTRAKLLRDAFIYGLKASVYGWTEPEARGSLYKWRSIGATSFLQGNQRP